MSRPAGEQTKRLGRWLASPELRAERLALPVLLFATAVLAWRATELPAAILVIIAASSLVAGAVVLRRAAAWLLGPVFFYDFLCSGRRGRYTAIRCAYATVLLGAVFSVYAEWFGTDSLGGPLPQDQVTRFANSFVNVFLLTQLAAVVLVTPALTAGAIADEKERRRMDFLLVTELHSHQIVLGKLASRLASVGLLLLTGLPVLGLMQFLGGVDPNLVLAGFAATAITLVSVGSIGVLASALCARSNGAMVLSYCLVACWLVLCWCPPCSAGHPLVAYHDLQKDLGNGLDVGEVLTSALLLYGGVHGLIICVAVPWAVALIRPHGRSNAAMEAAAAMKAVRAQHRANIALPSEMGASIPVADGCPSAGFRPDRSGRPSDAPILIAELQPADFVGWRRALPPIGNDPLLWKEMHLEQDATHEGIKTLMFTIGLFAGVVLLLIVMAALVNAVQIGESVSDVINPVIRILWACVGSLTLLGILFSAIGKVSRERELHTLDSLLTLPVERRDILWAKWLGSILGVRRLWWGAAILLTIGVLTSALHLLAAVLLILAWVAYASFAAGLGLWFSLTSPSKLQATVRSLVALGVLMLVSVLGGEPCIQTMPPVVFWTLAFQPQDRCIGGLAPRAGYPGRPETELDGLLMSLLGVVGYALAAVVLWLLCRARFEREKEGT